MFGRRRLETKTADQLRAMRVAGLLVGRTLELLADAVRPGVTTLALDTLAEDFIRSNGGIPNFQLVPGYRHTLCTSVNDEVVHGIPSGKRVLREGDVLSIDCGAEVNGWNGDAAITVVVGGREHASAPQLALIDATERSLYAGIAAMRAGARLCDIGASIEDSLGASERTSGLRFGVVEEYVGHGIGRSMHMDPQIPNYRVAQKGPFLPVGFTGAIEPMATLGSADTRVQGDGWTVVTVDGSPAAHWEHTAAVMGDGVWILTALDGGQSALSALGVPYSPLD